jgi:hypothetical protein
MNQQHQDERARIRYAAELTETLQLIAGWLAVPS